MSIAIKLDYTVVIDRRPTPEEPLGVNFNATSGGNVQIKSFTKMKGKLTFFESTGFCGPGDAIVAINGKSMLGKKYSKVQKKLARGCMKADAKHVSVAFRIVDGEFVASFKKVPLFGCNVAQDSVGHFYISSIHPDSHAHACSELHCGLIIVRVNGRKITGMAKSDGKSLIKSAFATSKIVNLRLADPALSRKFTSTETIEAVRRAAKKAARDDNGASPKAQKVSKQQIGENEENTFAKNNLTVASPIWSQQGTDVSPKHTKLRRKSRSSTIITHSESSPYSPLGHYGTSEDRKRSSRMKDLHMAKLLPGVLRWNPKMPEHPNPIHGLKCLPGNVHV